MFWNTLWRFSVFLVAAYQGLVRHSTATNIRTTEAVPTAVSPSIYAAASCPVNCLRGTCTFLHDGSVVCKDGCNDGYMGEMCDFPCMNKCSKCHRREADGCIKCNHGYFGKHCEHKCPCGGQGCLSDGICKKDCLAIHVCGDKCLPGCEICNETLGKCQKCAYNLMGEKCKTSCSDNCRSVCQSQNCTSPCDRDTGRCVHGCKPGFWGELCADQCSSRCLDQNCNQTSGHCVKCIRGYHGPKCHLPCVNCNDSGCLQSSGTCRKCDAGYYGHACTQICFNCSSNVCDRNNGLCVNVSLTTMDVAMTTTVYEFGNISISTVPAVTLTLAVFGAVSTILIIFLVCRLLRVRRSLITYRSGHQPSLRNVVYRNNEYDEINVEMMDPTSGNTNSDEPYYSPLVHLE